MRRLTACLVPVVILLLAAATDVFARAKTDVVVVLNGDHVTCEIKELQRGMLTVKTDDMGTLDIKWEKVIGLESGYYFRVEVSSGARFFGTPHLEQGDSVMRVTGVDAVAALDLVNVVSITPIEQSFLDRFDGVRSPCRRSAPSSGRFDPRPRPGGGGGGGGGRSFMDPCYAGSRPMPGRAPNAPREHPPPGVPARSSVGACIAANG